MDPYEYIVCLNESSKELLKIYVLEDHCGNQHAVIGALLDGEEVVVTQMGRKNMVYIVHPTVGWVQMRSKRGSPYLIPKKQYPKLNPPPESKIDDAPERKDDDHPPSSPEEHNSPFIEEEPFMKPDSGKPDSSENDPSHCSPFPGNPPPLTLNSVPSSTPRKTPHNATPTPPSRVFKDRSPPSTRGAPSSSTPRGATQSPTFRASKSNSLPKHHGEKDANFDDSDRYTPGMDDLSKSNSSSKRHSEKSGMFISGRDVNFDDSDRYTPGMDDHLMMGDDAYSEEDNAYSEENEWEVTESVKNLDRLQTINCRLLFIDNNLMRLEQKKKNRNDHYHQLKGFQAQKDCYERLKNWTQYGDFLPDSQIESIKRDNRALHCRKQTKKLETQLAYLRRNEPENTDYISKIETQIEAYRQISNPTKPWQCAFCDADNDPRLDSCKLCSTDRSWASPDIVDLVLKDYDAARSSDEPSTMVDSSGISSSNFSSDSKDDKIHDIEIREKHPSDMLYKLPINSISVFEWNVDFVCRWLKEETRFGECAMDFKKWQVDGKRLLNLKSEMDLDNWDVKKSLREPLFKKICDLKTSEILNILEPDIEESENEDVEFYDQSSEELGDVTSTLSTNAPRKHYISDDQGDAATNKSTSQDEYLYEATSNSANSQTSKRRDAISKRIEDIHKRMDDRHEIDDESFLDMASFQPKKGKRFNESPEINAESLLQTNHFPYDSLQGDSDPHQDDEESPPPQIKNSMQDNRQDVVLEIPAKEHEMALEQELIDMCRQYGK